jgi:integrase
MSKKITFPHEVTKDGVTARIYQQAQTKGEKEYISFVVSYTCLGKRKQERHSEFEKALQAAKDAIIKIGNGEQLALELKNGDRMIYLRAQEAVKPIGAEIDVACREYADVIAILKGKGSPVEAARFFMKSHNVTLPKISVSQAVDEMIEQSKKDGKSQERLHQLSSYLNRLKTSFNSSNVADLTPKLLGDFIIALNVSERTKKNCRDVLDAFCRWCIGRGYLSKDSDLMEHVQKYKNKKIGKIEIFAPEELRNLLTAADVRFIPYLAIRAFAGVRGKEVQRLDWKDIDLADGFITIHADVAKTDERRLIPIKDNLKAWLAPLAKTSGPVCPFANAHKQLGIVSKAASVPWRKNALRHSYVSYRVAECADVPRVADESGNSPAVIRTNYLKRVKPAQAVEWFAIAPDGQAAKS